MRRLEVTAAAKTFDNESQAHAALSGESTQDQLWILAALSLLRDQANTSQHLLASRQLSQFIESHLNTLDKSQRNGLQEAFNDLQSQFDSSNNKDTVNIHVSTTSIVVDYGLRWLILIWLTVSGLGLSFVTPINILAVPLITYLIFYFKSRSDKNYHVALLEKYNLAGTTVIRYRYGALFYSLVILFISTGTYISTLLADTIVQLSLITFVGLALHYFFLAQFFPSGRINESDFLLQLEKKRHNLQYELDRDENDAAIVSLESRFNSKNSRLEAFVLESALFGALSFSGFLQVMSTDMVSFADLEKFAQLVFDASKAAVSFDSAAYAASVAQLKTKEYLFCLVSVESLICSVFFLGVIAVRLRFSNIADRVSLSINSAKAFNEKEEFLGDPGKNDNEKLQQRLSAITQRVNTEIRAGNKAMEEFSPVVNFMQYFRNAGILTFLVILITSSVLVTSVLAWLFLLLAFASVLYFNSGVIVQTWKIMFLKFQVSFTRNHRRFLALALAPFVLGFFARVLFHIRATDWLIALGFVSFGLYLFSWLILLPHFDEKYGEIDNPNAVTKNRWATISYAFGIVVVVSSTSIALSIISHSLNSITLISMTALTASMIVIAIMLSKKIWIGILLGFLFTGVVFAVLFKVLQLTGSLEMILVGTVMILLAVLLWPLVRRHCHAILGRVLFFLVFVVVVITGFPNEGILDWRLADRLRVMYEHESLVTGRAFRLEGLSYDVDPDDAGLTSEFFKEAEWYESEFGTTFGFTSVYGSMARNANWRTYTWYLNAKQHGDSSNIKTALSLAEFTHQMLSKISYDPMFSDPRLDSSSEPYILLADLLLFQGKKDEALRQLKATSQLKLPDYRRKLVEEKITSIEKENN
ncbi:MAG: hypothetical protein WDO14_19395 [Bacteroidota bacterium]